MCIRDSIWVASEYSGLSRISVLNEGTSRIYPESRDLFDRSNTIRMLTRMSNGDICVGTRKGGLYTFDSSLHSKMTNQYFHSNIYALTEDKQLSLIHILVSDKKEAIL